MCDLRPGDLVVKLSLYDREEFRKRRWGRDEIREYVRKHYMSLKDPRMMIVTSTRPCFLATLVTCTSGNVSCRVYYASLVRI